MHLYVRYFVYLQKLKSILKMEQNWKSTLSHKLNFLGHRNWIVVTDMAYPMQSNPGVTTLFANEDFAKVVECTLRMIEEAPHVCAHIYVDEEQHAMSDRLCEGWSAYQRSLADALGKSEINYVPHEELIHRLDSVSSTFNAIIIKTPLTIPYTSVFFELDCAYWDAAREKEIRQ